MTLMGNSNYSTRVQVGYSTGRLRTGSAPLLIQHLSTPDLGTNHGEIPSGPSTIDITGLATGDEAKLGDTFQISLQHLLCNAIISNLPAFALTDAVDALGSVYQHTFGCPIQMALFEDGVAVGKVTISPRPGDVIFGEPDKPDMDPDIAEAYSKRGYYQVRQ